MRAGTASGTWRAQPRRPGRPPRAARPRAACAPPRTPPAVRPAAPRSPARVHCRRPGRSRVMHYRRLGKTGLDISEIGYGAWGIGQTMWIGADDQESLRALDRAIDLGLNFIDTALAYGNGHSEELVGKVVRRRPETVFVATKIPPRNSRWPASPEDRADDAFPAGH